MLRSASQDPPPSERSEALALLRDGGIVLLLLAAATCSLLALRLRPGRRGLRVRAKLRARLPWLDGDAAVVLGAVLFLVSGTVVEAWRGRLAVDPAPPAPGAMLLAALLPPLFALLLCAYRGVVARRSPSELLGVRRRTWRRDAALGVWGGLAILLPCLLLSYASGQVLASWGVPPSLQPAMRWFSDPNTPWAVRALVVVQGVFVAPFLEEALYRCVLLSVALRHGGPARAVFLVSLLFGAMHLEAQVLLPLLFVGAACSVGLLATGSLVTPIAMHMAFNAGNLLLVAAAGTN